MQELFPDGLTPDTQIESMSRGQLLDLLRLYSRMFLAMDGFWYLTLRESFGEGTAIDHDLRVWDRYIKHEYRLLRAFLDEEGQDVAAFFRVLAFCTWARTFDMEWDIPAPDRGSLRVLHCPVLDALRREGEGRDEWYCRRVDRKLFEMQARHFNPHLKVLPVELPPRVRDQDICCSWELRC